MRIESRALLPDRSSAPPSRRAAIRTFPCPTCGAQPGHPCLSLKPRTFGLRYEKMHRARIEAYRGGCEYCGGNGLHAVSCAHPRKFAHLNASCK